MERRYTNEELRWKLKVEEQVPFNSDEYFNFLLFLFIRHDDFVIEEGQDDNPILKLTLEAQNPSFDMAKFQTFDNVLADYAEAIKLGMSWQLEEKTTGIAKGPCAESKYYNFGEIHRIKPNLHLFYLEDDNLKSFERPLLFSGPISPQEIKILCSPSPMQYAEMAQKVWQASENFIRASEDNA